MVAALPTPELLWRAIDIYLAEAYGGPPGKAVTGRLQTLKREAPDKVHESPALERDSTGGQNHFRLRLGNRSYPHMKLLWEESPDGRSYLFKCDTHDRHCCPAPTSPEYKGFLQLMQSNEEIAKRVEAAWDAADVPTFKHYLREDLQRRRATLAGDGAANAERV
ncbi:MAG: hypothetical protein JO353_12275 [Phycisphaerae bacterium]|nr:hypothetical protein [Phycisphaerae bacterium]